MLQKPQVKHTLVKCCHAVDSRNASCTCQEIRTRSAPNATSRTHLRFQRHSYCFLRKIFVWKGMAMSVISCCCLQCLTCCSARKDCRLPIVRSCSVAYITPNHPVKRLLLGQQDWACKLAGASRCSLCSFQLCLQQDAQYLQRDQHYRQGEQMLERPAWRLQHPAAAA